MTLRNRQEYPDWYHGSSRKEMLSFVPSSAVKILDVGCSEGKFGELVKRRNNAEIWGIEYDSTSAEKAAKVLDNVLVGDASTLLGSLEPNFFDCICFLDVLEHLVDTEKILETTKILLKKDGLIVLSVPNVMYIGNLYRLLVKKDWKYLSHGILDKTHLRFFTKRSIKELLEYSGYKVVELKGMSPYQGIPFLIFNLLTLGHFRDSRYLQFALVAKPISATTK